MRAPVPAKKHGATCVHSLYYTAVVADGTAVTEHVYTVTPTRTARNSVSRAVTVTYLPVRDR